jgi:hypothetical protein
MHKYIFMLGSGDTVCIRKYLCLVSGTQYAYLRGHRTNKKYKKSTYIYIYVLGMYNIHA